MPKLVGKLQKRRSVLILLFLISPIATANMTIAQYREAKAQGGDIWDNVQTYVAGLGTGIATANAMLTLEHKARYIVSR